MKRMLILGSVVALGIAALLIAGEYYLTPISNHQSTADADNLTQVRLGMEIYAAHCGSCHGKNLEGQQNWKSPLPTGGLSAPPHDETGHTWHHPDELLFNYTKLGGQALVPPGVKSNMPGFSEQLSDRQIWAVLAFIKSRWPKQIRRRHAELNRRGK